MGSRAMAVKLILVVLLVAVVASGLAQQSSDRQRTGGEDSSRSDRRLNNLRRFRNRNRSNKETEDSSDARPSARGTASRSRLADQDKIAERRRQLLQRNGVSRRRKVVKTEVNEIPEEQTKKPIQNIRIRTTTEKSIEVIPVERITNNDQEIINAALDNYVEEEKTLFSGVSEVRPLSRPSGFRSSNEQIVSVKFKKTTAAPEEKDFAPTQAPRRRFQPNRNTLRKGLLGRRPATRAPTPEIETTTKVILLSQASDALKALLKTANEDEAVEVPAEVQTNVLDENLPEDAEAAVLEMEEDNGHIKATPAPRGRSRGDRRRVRVNLRGRGQQRVRTEDSEDTEAPRQSSGSRRDRFRSFPARQGGSRDIGRPSGARNRIVTPRTQTTQRVEAVEVVAPVTEAATEATRFEARPTVSAPVVNTPARIPDFKIFDDFEGFTFPSPVRAPPTTASPAIQAAEVPRSQASPVPVPGQSQFTLQQNFVPQQVAPAPVQPQQFVPQPQTIQRPQPVPQPQTVPVQRPQAVPARQPVPQQQTVFAQQPQQPAQPQRVQPFVAFNNQQFQSLTPQQPQQPQAAPAANRFQPQTAAPQPQAGSFNLLNPSNFQAFDAQFGGSVPSNNARPVSASNIFAQPQSALLQGRDVLVNPFSGQQPSVFGQQQNLFGQQPATSNNFQAFRSG